VSVTPPTGAMDSTTYVSALGDADWRIRWQACQTLGELGDKRSIWPLIRALEDRNQWVRVVAAEALGQIGSQQATSALILALDDDSIWVRRASVVALGQIGDEEAIPPLMNRLLDPPNSGWPEDLRDTIAKAMGAIGEPALQTLICALRDPDPWVNCAAARALGKIGDSHAIAPLAALTKQKHSMVRSFATQALAQIADVRAVRAALTTDEAPRAFWKLMALKEIDESTLDQLRGLLDDPDEQIRVQAAEVLRHLGDESSAEPLVSTRWATPRTVPANESVTLSHPTQARAQTAPEQSNGTGPLLKALHDPVADVRLAAAEALGKTGDARVIPALSEALQDTDSRVRAAAARSLGEIGARPSPGAQRRT
jgi:HEAT repeat protein